MSTAPESGTAHCDKLRESRETQRNSRWNLRLVAAGLVLSFLSSAITWYFTSQAQRQTDLELFIAAAPILATTPKEREILVDSAIQLVGPQQLADLVRRRRIPPTQPAQVDRPVLTGLMLSDSSKIDSMIVQLRASRSPIVLVDNSGKPLLPRTAALSRLIPPVDTGVKIGEEGHRVEERQQRSGPADVPVLSGVGGRRGAYIGDYGELVCYGACSGSQACCGP